MKTFYLTAGAVNVVRRCGRAGLRSLLDLVYPETCALCGATPDYVPWCAPGAVVPGLSWRDGCHLCRACAVQLAARPVRAVINGGQLSVYGGRSPCADLVRVLAQWKYHGVGGLAWPLSGLVNAAVGEAIRRDGRVDLLVPVALHRRRQRTRGFNQAEVLAQLTGAAFDIPVACDLLRRTRPTGQQAKLKTAAVRQQNLAGAFAAARPPAGREVCQIGLVDDLVTSGATCEAAVAALAARGWQVRWVAALGVAAAAGQNPEYGPAPLGSLRP